MKENIFDEKKLIAQVFNLDALSGTIFPTPEEESFQFGYSQVESDKTINPHIHNRVKRIIDNTSEFLFVLSGRMEISILNELGEIINNVILTNNMCLLQFYGGHKIKIFKGTRFFELKQGPYLGKNIDKKEIKK